MTQPTDYFSHSGSESGRGLHTQESGDDGLSSNMEHKFSDHHYDETALSVAVEGISFVRPIPKEELDIFDGPEMPGNIGSHPSVFEHATGPKAHPVSAEEGVIKPSTLENRPEEETVMVLPGTVVITEGQPDVEVVAEESCHKMDTEENPAEPKSPPLGGRNSSHRRKRAAGKNQKLYLLCWMAFMHIPVSGGCPGAEPAADQKFKSLICMDKDRCPKLMKIFHTDDTTLYHRDLNETFPECSGISPPGLKSCVVCRDQSKIIIHCSEDVGPKMDVEDSDGEEILNISPAFKSLICMDKDRCPKLMKIFHTDDTTLYHRDLNETFPECSGISPPGLKSCVVCRDQSKIIIHCSEDVGPKMDVEDSDGEEILNISPVCQTPGRSRIGLILSIVFFLIVVGALVIYSSYSYNRPFEGNHNADVARDEIEFDTPVENHIKKVLVTKVLPGKKD